MFSVISEPLLNSQLFVSFRTSPKQFQTGSKKKNLTFMSTILEKCSFNYDQPCRGMVSGKKKEARINGRPLAWCVPVFSMEECCLQDS